MDERRDRPVKKLKEVQCRQDDIMETFAPSQAKRDKASEKNAQRNRERGAEKVWRNEEKCTNAPLAALNLYATKTKARLENKANKTNRLFLHEMIYKSILTSISITQRKKIDCMSLQNAS